VKALATTVPLHDLDARKSQVHIGDYTADNARVGILLPGAGDDAAVRLQTRGIRAFGDEIVSVVIAGYLVVSRAASLPSSPQRCTARRR
jgi:hypothetical protein